MPQSPHDFSLQRLSPASLSAFDVELRATQLLASDAHVLSYAYDVPMQEYSHGLQIRPPDRTYPHRTRGYQAPNYP